MPKSCTKQTTKKYRTRNSPPYPANAPGCRFTRRRGNDGFIYESVVNSHNICTWRKRPNLKSQAISTAARNTIERQQRMTKKTKTKTKTKSKKKSRTKSKSRSRTKSKSRSRTKSKKKPRTKSKSNKSRTKSKKKPRTKSKSRSRTKSKSKSTKCKSRIRRNGKLGRGCRRRTTHPSRLCYLHRTKTPYIPGAYFH
jgi:type IV secretory pathway VirB10-like protein